MPGELLLINPSRRKRSRTKRRKHSYARRNPTRRKRRPTSLRTYASATGLIPAKRYSRKRRRSSRSRRAFSSIRRRYSSMAGGTIGSFITGKLVPATVGAGGALALDMLWPQLPLPDSLKGGPFAPAVRIAGAIGIGMAASAVGGRKFGQEAMGGALVVTIYDLAKGLIQAEFPSVPMNAYVSGNNRLGWYSPAQQVGSRMGAFVDDFDY